jgi:hypothetical protein
LVDEAVEGHHPNACRSLCRDGPSSSGLIVIAQKRRVHAWKESSRDSSCVIVAFPLPGPRPYSCIRRGHYPRHLAASWILRSCRYACRLRLQDDRVCSAISASVQSVRPRV